LQDPETAGAGIDFAAVVVNGMDDHVLQYAFRADPGFERLVSPARGVGR
jgi:hypothetical protein